MASAPCPTDLRNSTPAPITAGNVNWLSAIRPHEWLLACNPFRARIGPIAIGFWLGGIALGIGGLILGARMPYRHPVGVSLSILWWGIYLGCFGASIGASVGAWFGLRANSGPAVPSQVSHGAGELPNCYGLNSTVKKRSEETWQPCCFTIHWFSSICSTLER
jgi:hypothetical protein